MKVEIKVPAMGESISQATIGTLFKPSGSRVEADEEILELETDKVNQALYAPQAGVLNLSVSPGTVVKIGQSLGYIDTEATASAESQEKPVKEVKQEPSLPKKEAVAAPKAQPAPQRPAEKGARQTTEMLLKEMKSEAQSTAEKSETLPASLAKPKEIASHDGEKRETRRPMTTIRKVIAARLLEAQSSTVMLTTFNEVDMSQVIALREKYKEAFQKEHAVKLGFMSFFVKASVAALQAVPDVNSFIEGDDIVHREYFDISIAVGTEKGVFVPVVRNCDHLSFAGIELAIENYAKKARDGKLLLDDLRGGGFTITNGGVYGSLLSTPILNPPQSGILGMHKIEKRPVVLDDQITIRPMMYLALSYDHRIIDGKDAVTFLVHIKNALEDPARLLLEV